MAFNPIGYNIDCPCKGCNDRSIGCHENCRLYALYKEKVDSARKNEQEYRSIYRDKTARKIAREKKIKI
ncbi:MAG: hypothetical protein KBS91_04175 [Firmicutes bacterium]|nr:hypothetical protein [Candidatus Caballimonas caccae]